MITLQSAIQDIDSDNEETKLQALMFINDQFSQSPNMKLRFNIGRSIYSQCKSSTGRKIVCEQFIDSYKYFGNKTSVRNIDLSMVFDLDLLNHMVISSKSKAIGILIKILNRPNLDQQLPIITDFVFTNYLSFIFNNKDILLIINYIESKIGTYPNNGSIQDRVDTMKYLINSTDNCPYSESSLQKNFNFLKSRCNEEYFEQLCSFIPNYVQDDRGKSFINLLYTQEQFRFLTTKYLVCIASETELCFFVTANQNYDIVLYLSDFIEVSRFICPPFMDTITDRQTALVTKIILRNPDSLSSESLISFMNRSKISNTTSMQSILDKIILNCSEHPVPEYHTVSNLLKKHKYRNLVYNTDIHAKIVKNIEQIATLPIPRKHQPDFRQQTGPLPIPSTESKFQPKELPLPSETEIKPYKFKSRFSYFFERTKYEQNVDKR